MELNQLPGLTGTKQDSKRKGRGIGSGLGKTAGRGHKGQKARAGGFHKLGFEGGQMPLQRRLPKRGFNNIFKKVFEIIKVNDLEQFEANSVIGAEQLKSKGLIRGQGLPIKLLGDGELTKPIEIHVDQASQSALSKVQMAGGQVVTARATEERVSD
ncbi:MAG: 50S ribosomal protein L15 [Magnetococcus sp. DMHC-6]